MQVCILRTVIYNYYYTAILCDMNYSNSPVEFYLNIKFNVKICKYVHIHNIYE